MLDNMFVIISVVGNGYPNQVIGLFKDSELAAEWLVKKGAKRRGMDEFDLPSNLFAPFTPPCAGKAHIREICPKDSA